MDHPKFLCQFFNNIVVPLQILDKSIGKFRCFYTSSRDRKFQTQGIQGLKFVFKGIELIPDIRGADTLSKSTRKISRIIDRIVVESELAQFVVMLVLEYCILTMPLTIFLLIIFLIIFLLIIFLKVSQLKSCLKNMRTKFSGVGLCLSGVGLCLEVLVYFFCDAVKRCLLHEFRVIPILFLQIISRHAKQ